MEHGLDADLLFEVGAVLDAQDVPTQGRTVYVDGRMFRVEGSRCKEIEPGPMDHSKHFKARKQRGRNQKGRGGR